MKSQPENAPLLDYPCFYTFKAIGKTAAADEAALEEHVRALVGSVLGQVGPEACSTRESGKGSYQSVSVQVHLQSEEQRRAVYETFWKDERIVFYL